MNRPSSKGKPTDPKLREKVKEEVKQETNKDGGGKGEWSAWKVWSCIPLFFSARTELLLYFFPTLLHRSLKKMFVFGSNTDMDVLGEQISKRV